MKCLESLVGLSQRDCDCHEYPEDYDKSLSGFFIESLMDGAKVQWTDASTDCGDGGVWEVLTEARRLAAKDVINDLGAIVAENNVQTMTNWRGLIGQPKKNRPLTNYNSGQLQGIRIVPFNVRGAVAVVHSVGFVSADETALLPFVIENDNGDEIASFDIQAEANQTVTHEFTEPLILPLTSPGGGCIEYYIYYDHSVGNGNPKDIKIRASGCGSCGRRAKHPYRHYADIRGFSGVTELENNQSTTLTYGISADIEFRCTFYDWMCSEISSSLSPYMMVVAKTMQLYAVNHVYGFILNSDRINRYTLLGREELMGKMKHNNKEIHGRMQYLSENMPYEKVDCILCRSSKNLSIRSLS